ncbi:MAG: hypothetical protein AB8H47_13530 [Bacteroidia bacterium]
MTLLTKKKTCTKSLSSESIYDQKPYGYLTKPDPAKANDFTLRAMFLLDYIYTASPVISQSNSGSVHYVDIDLGARSSSTTPYFTTEEIDLIQASGEERIVLRLFENQSGSSVQLGEVTLFFADSDDEAVSDFGPSAYIVNTPDGGDNTAVSALIPLDGYIIEDTNIVYDSGNKTFEITIDVVADSGSDPIEYSTTLEMDEDDSVEFVVKKGGSKKGKTNLKKQYADTE